ncbi:PIG-L family deacetylase [Roseateles sp. SL47]|uniref:PIG-L deacetylase family protein n=1 Tax=Roseateles sp. SL47 TaxID=2995138 RepID=UPI00226E58F0|nr:PIG-L family deacetylase [Roseateles sp. SL47]WAC71226.1 PIG-L family deacetylase [Roseateles sp. SL47]
MPELQHSLTSTSSPDTWEAWVRRWCEVLQQAPRDSLAGSAMNASAADVGTGANRPHALVFAPHPDDECIVGALPLRLKREAGWRVTNIAVTLGSRQGRRAERWAELQAACEVLGFEVRLLAEQGLEQVKPEAADAGTPLWQAQVALVAALLKTERPGLILVPHAGDGIPTHIGVHRLVAEALHQSKLSTVVAWTEFWATQPEPNLLVETGIADTACLVRALSCHHGEIARNPYHLRLPAWMADNVRRGGELLAGAGETPPAFGFATLYRLSRWIDGQPANDLPATMAACDVPLPLLPSFWSLP